MVGAPPAFLGGNSTAIPGVTGGAVDPTVVAYVYDFGVLLSMVTFAALKCYFNTFMLPLYAVISCVGFLVSLIYNLSSLGVRTGSLYGIAFGYPCLIIWLSALCKTTRRRGLRTSARAHPRACSSRCVARQRLEAKLERDTTRYPNDRLFHRCRGVRRGACCVVLTS